MFGIMSTIRGLLMDHLDNFQPLLATLPIGSTVVSVPNTGRFRENDEVYIINPAANLAEAAWIVQIPEYNQLVISTVDPKSSGFTVPVGSSVAWSAVSSQIHKAIGHEPLKRVHIGDLRPIPDFPTITISPGNETNEWLTFRGTSHEYKVAIRVYVMADNFESSEELLSKMAKQIREILFDHVQLPVDFQSFPLTADVPVGGSVLQVSDTSKFFPGAFVVVRDAKKRPHVSQIGYIRSVLSPTEVELSCSMENDYLVVRQAEVLLASRYLYDTRPSDISYGYVPGTGGSFMRAAEISWFGKEMVLRDPPVLLT